jgi:hypothetical protein
MMNLEANLDSLNEKPDSVEIPALRGREAVSTEEALVIQQNLIMMMVPPELSEHITGDIEDPVLNALAMHWMQKYAIEFNGFAKYCNENANNSSFIERVTHNSLTDKDYESMRKFLEGEEGGSKERPFFTTDELDEFIKDNIH